MLQSGFEKYMQVRSLLPPVAKRAARKSLGALGLTVVSKPSELEKKFAPDKADELKWIQKASVSTVLDIGAHAGETSRQMRSILPGAFIYAFEPLLEPYTRLVSEMAGDRKFASFQFALGASKERIEMHRNEFTQSSSLLEMADRHRQEFPFTAKSVQESIEVRRLDDIASVLSLNDNILIKIDTQGFEDKVIAGGEHTIRRASIVIIEVSFVELYEGQPLFAVIYDRFRDLGFSYGGALHQLRSPFNGQPLQADALFTRG